ncbi:MAG: N-acetyl-alpha-D-glucosaminyl L-malate synthase BshA [Bacteroidota bacterium]
MKIGVVCYPTYGGSGVIATELGKAMARAGHEIHFISYAQPARLDAFTENVYFHEVNSIKYPLFEHEPYVLALASKLVDVVQYEKLEILHIHYAIPHATAAFLAQSILREKGINIPFVTTLHGTDITIVGKDATFEPVVSFSINHSDGVTAVSESLKADTLMHFHVGKEIKVIPNFIDFTRFKYSPKDHFKTAIAPNGEKIMVHTSNFRKVKRIDHVIEIFAKVRGEIPSKLLLVGDGPERRNAEMLCRELNVTEDVRFLGKQDAIEEILSVSDLFLMPSETESFGLAALEAMACRVPVVSSNTGGIPEVNVEGVTGFLRCYKDVQGMADAAISLLGNDELLSRMKEQAYQHALNFDIQEIMPQYIEFYKQFLVKTD